MKNKNYIKVLFRHDAFEGENVESAWVRIENGKYILDNILFYAKEYSWGDQISIEENSGEYFATGLISESGHSTVRILFPNVEKRDEIRNQLREMGCSSEVSNIEKLLSVDVPPNVSYFKISNFLDQMEAKEELEYEEACISSSHRK